MPGEAQPKTESISCGVAAREIIEVLVGALWLCAGRFDLAWSPAKEAHGVEEIRGMKYLACPIGQCGCLTPSIVTRFSRIAEFRLKNFAAAPVAILYAYTTTV